jgi:putative phosphotransacetylase
MSDARNVEPKPVTVALEVPIGVSGRHMHLAKDHVEKLFGPGHKLTATKALSQPGQFACDECVTLKTAKGCIDSVRVLGPERPETQIELSVTDTFRLKLDQAPPVRLSGKIAGSPGVTLVGPAGEVTINEGVIISQRHLHMTPDEAQKFGFQDKQLVAIASGGPRQVVFANVIIRVHETYRLDFHIDTDEANAAGVKTGDKAYIIDNFELPTFGA